MSSEHAKASRWMLIYRRGLDARSGAGQLVAMQADGLRAAGHKVTLAAKRHRLKYFLRTGRWVRRMAPSFRRPHGPLIIDHGCELEYADVVFVHGLYSAAARYVQRDDWHHAIAAEARFFERIRRDLPVVANSALVKAGLVEQHGLEPGQVSVLHPGYDAKRFQPAVRAALRQQARAALGVAPDQPLIGLVASGDFLLRGLTTFLAAASRIQRALPGARFLVVGAKRLPEYAIDHRLRREGRLIHRAKSSAPERWLSALDVFLHTSNFDAYGMVVAEALALGVPVVTSRRCGVSERMRGRYRAFVLDRPDEVAFAESAIALLADPELRDELVAEGLHLVDDATDAHYGRGCVRLIERAIGLEPAA